MNVVRKDWNHKQRQRIPSGDRFLCVNRDAAKPQVVKAGNIENAFTLFNSSRDIWRRKMLQNRMSTLDLAAECARIEERNKMRKELEGILEERNMRRELRRL